MLTIFDPHAFEILTEVEGIAWAQSQTQRPENLYSFFRYQKAAIWLKAKQRSGELAEDITVKDVVDSGEDGGLSGGDGLIYGEAGLARYLVSYSGEIGLHKSSTRPERAAKAEALGIRLI